MEKQRRKHSAEFKAWVALNPFRGLKTVSKIAAEFEVHQIVVSNWKKEMLASLPEVFEKKSPKQNQDDQKETADRERKVGQLTMEVCSRRLDRFLRVITNRSWLLEATGVVLCSSGAKTPGVDGVDRQKMLQDQHYQLEIFRVFISQKQMRNFKNWEFRHFVIGLHKVLYLWLWNRYGKVISRSLLMVFGLSAMSSALFVQSRFSNKTVRVLLVAA